MCLTVFHKVGVVPSPQVAEKKVQPQNLPDDTAAVVGGPKIGIYVIPWPIEVLLAPQWRVAGCMVGHNPSLPASVINLVIFFLSK